MARLHWGLVLAGAFAAGIWIRGAGGPVLAAACCALAAAGAALVAPVRALRPPAPAGRIVLRISVFVLAGILRGTPGVPVEDRGEAAPPSPVRLEGTIDVPPVETVVDRMGRRAVFTTFSLAPEPHGAPVRVICEGALPSLRGGGRVQASGMLLPPRRPANPGDLEGSTEAVLVVPHPRAVAPLPAPRVPGRAAMLGAVRGAVQGALVDACPERTRGFIIAMLLGDRRHLPDEIRDALLLTGTYHLLAISGLHVGLVLGLVVRIPSPRRLRLPLRLLALAAFAIVTGASPPVMRAAVMFAIEACLEAAGRKPRPLNTLGWTAIVLLTAEPGLLGDVGFQLSFAAVAAILTWGERLSRRRGREVVGSLALTERRGGALIRLAGASLAISLGVSVATAPLILQYFHRLHPLGVLWNLLAYPLTVVPLAGGAAVSALALLHPVLARPVAWVVDEACWSMLSILAAGARLPGSSVSLPPPGWLAVAASYGVLTLGLIGKRGGITKEQGGRRPRLRRTAFSLGIMALAAVSAPGLLWRPRPEVWTLDAAGGDASLLRAPGAGAFLIDAGARGSDSRAGMTLARAVLATGEAAIHGVFLTHADLDHVRALEGLAGRLRVGRLWVSPRFGAGHAGERVLGWARAKGIPIERLSRGSRISFPGAMGLEARVLHPPLVEALPAPPSRNDASMALRLELRGSRFLWLGDLEEDGLARLFASGDDLRADVLLAPHHGRANRLWPELLLKVNPRAVVISGSGDGGARTLARWLEERGLAVYATWRGGAVRTAWEEGKGWVPAYWRE